SFDVVQHKNLSRSRRKSLDRGRDIHPVGIPRHCCRGRENILTTVFFIFLHPLARPSFILPVGQHDVYRNSVNPCRESAFSPELRKLFPRPHEHVLRQLFSSNPASTHSRAECKNPIYVSVVKPLECTPVPRRCERDVRRISRRGGRLHHECC